MILRWTVEGRFSATFTSSKKVVDEKQAIKMCVNLGLQNHREKYCKNSDAVLYDDNNNVIKRLKIVK